MTPTSSAPRRTERPRGSMRARGLLALALGTVSVSPAPAGPGVPAGLAAPRPLASPAGAGSREPDLAVLSDGRVLMSWLEPGRGDGMALRCATYDGRRWTRPATIAAGDSFFVNWADFPSVRALGGTRLAAHWLWRNGAGTYAYDVRVSQSEDGGRTWGLPLTPHRDGTATEHGFVSLVADSGEALAVWLDGRRMAGHDEGAPGPMPDMTLRTARVARDGALRHEAELDPRTCECCQTAAVATGQGVLVAYRDRGRDEVRDIFVTRRAGGVWTEPRPVHRDGWRIEACPVNDPALDAHGSRVAIAWYTAAGDTPRVHVAFSDDAGERFGTPVRIDDGDPIGRVDIVLLGDGGALVTWLEARGREARIRARRVAADGVAAPAITVARTSAARASGFPRVVSHRDGLVFAWTETGPSPRVRLAVLRGK